MQNAFRKLRYFSFLILDIFAALDLFIVDVTQLDDDDGSEFFHIFLCLQFRSFSCFFWSFRVNIFYFTERGYREYDTFSTYLFSCEMRGGGDKGAGRSRIDFWGFSFISDDESVNKREASEENGESQKIYVWWGFIEQNWEFPVKQLSYELRVYEKLPTFFFCSLRTNKNIFTKIFSRWESSSLTEIGK